MLQVAQAQFEVDVAFEGAGLEFAIQPAEADPKHVLVGGNFRNRPQAFIDIQGKLQEQSKAFYETNKIGPEMWTQFVNMQAPMIQSMMSSYIEQSKDLFVQMQENMQKQARSMFTGFPGFPSDKK